ncbi:Auxin-responsive protein SAUR36 [Camellia lanceoleosa]|uniref:Auxin-responsive protein SAUR36 n=1 Tax=Camellia lanceoleosa TaxID=1840588 RepID=A0ACC0FMS7_9ERIC|nr:Auxin-responsive protein SAUR36 [Camellia lanceoleosa]
MTKLCDLGRALKSGAKGLCFSKSKSKSDYMRVGQEIDPIEGGVSKGHLAVYVGEKEDDTHRYLVPVIYINHPLLGKLLEEAVNEYGFDHSGGIQIPCRISEFENVRTRIAAAGVADRRIRQGCRLR